MPTCARKSGLGGAHCCAFHSSGRLQRERERLFHHSVAIHHMFAPRNIRDLLHVYDVRHDYNTHTAHYSISGISGSHASTSAAIQRRQLPCPHTYTMSSAISTISTISTTFLRPAGARDLMRRTCPPCRTTLRFVGLRRTFRSSRGRLFVTKQVNRRSAFT